MARSEHGSDHRFVVESPKTAALLAIKSRSSFSSAKCRLRYGRNPYRILFSQADELVHVLDEAFARRVYPGIEKIDQRLLQQTCRLAVPSYRSPKTSATGILVPVLLQLVDRHIYGRTLQ